MTVERGLVVARKVIPGTERVRRGPDWWNPGDIGTRPRAGLVEIGAGHWTAGRTNRTGPQVIRAMKARLKNGRPLNVAVHFVIQWDGVIWQAADPGLTATCHVGKGYVNARSVSAETCWPGTLANARRIGDPEVDRAEHGMVSAAGHRAEILHPSDELLEAWVWLMDTLAALDGEAGIAIPRQVPSGLGRRFTPAEAKRWAGAMEHHLTPGTTKLDAAGRLLGALAEAGWRVRSP